MVVGICESWNFLIDEILDKGRAVESIAASITLIYIGSLIPVT